MTHVDVGACRTRRLRARRAMLQATCAAGDGVRHTAGGMRGARRGAWYNAAPGSWRCGKERVVCRRFVAVDRAEVARIAAEVARSLEAREDAGGKLGGTRCARKLSGEPVQAGCGRPRGAPRRLPFVGCGAHRAHGAWNAAGHRGYDLGIRGTLEEGSRVQHAHRDGARRLFEHVARVA